MECKRSEAGWGLWDFARSLRECLLRAQQANIEFSRYSLKKS